MLGPDGPVGRMLAAGRLASIVFWGPPGCGKTTIARLLAGAANLHFTALSAVFSGVADLRKVFAEAESRREAGRGTMLFVDEIHRFNRAQQDGFLPWVENGTVVLVGATTENPSFELNAALLSRAQVLVLRRLDEDGLETLLERAEASLGAPLPLDDGARTALKALADGDGRYLLNLAEEVTGRPLLDAAGLARLAQRRAPVYDKDREGHYNLISALHKSLRGSDPDAALYWLARMLDGGEDPRYVARPAGPLRLGGYRAGGPGGSARARSPVGRRMSGSAAPRANSRLPRPCCISPPRPSPTPPMRLSERPCARRARPARSCRRCTA